jgi:hypothetical protein
MNISLGLILEIKMKPLRFEILTVVEITVLFFWGLTPCGLAGRF